MSGASTNPGLYPGNPSLPREVRDKILSTFKHTLNLYQEGKLDDCVIGCDFILKMDPRFSPARRLLEKTKNPAADIDLIELEAIVATTPARTQRASAADAEKLLVRAVESLNARDFDACINAAEQVLTALPGNVHATDLVEKARRKKEAQGEFEASRSRALSLLEARRHKDAGLELERMRSLDAEHPAVSLLERRIAQAASPPGRPAAPEPAPSLGGMMDFGQQATQEPKISFQRPESLAAPAGDLDSLSLDSLSLDAPQATAVLPPPDFPATRRGPLDLPGGGAPAADRGSPGDLWSEGDSAEPPPPPAPSPSRPQPAPRAAEEDPAKAEREIGLLLKQGDEALARGQHEGAIEIWSRIFLIDINSVEAVTRIENARQAMAEGDKRVAEALQKGKQAFEAGDLEAARTAFLQALVLQDNEPTARSYLDRIEQKESGFEPSVSIADLKPQPETGTSVQEVPEPEEPEPARKKKTARPGLQVNPKVAMIAAAFVALVAIGSWLVLRQPKPAPAPAAPVQAGGSLEKATAFFQEGKIPETVAELKRIRPTDPDYAKARQLLETLEKSAGEQVPPPVAAGQPLAAPGSTEANDPAPIRARGEQALSEKRYIDALKDFSVVAPSFQGDPTFAQSMTVASDRVTELTPAVKLYNEGEYETVIPVLWRIYQADKGNQDARSYLLRSYTNQGITQLQNGLYDKAKQSLDEALVLAPQDRELLRHRKFAERYQKGDLDLLGRIYVRHLSHQP